MCRTPLPNAAERAELPVSNTLAPYTQEGSAAEPEKGKRVRHAEPSPGLRNPPRRCRAVYVSTWAQGREADVHGWSWQQSPTPTQAASPNSGSSSVPRFGSMFMLSLWKPLSFTKPPAGVPIVAIESSTGGARGHLSHTI